MKNTIELISIGSELLSGRTLNSHAQTLGAALTDIGLAFSRDTTIPDGIEIIQSAVREAFERAILPFGPRNDDYANIIGQVDSGIWTALMRTM